MKVLGKLENVKLLKVEMDFSMQYHTYHGWEFRGVARYKIGHKKYKCEFIYLEKSEYKIAYLESRIKGYTIPAERLQNEALLVLLRGEVEKYFGRVNQINYFTELRAKEEEEKRAKEEEERKKKVALGEQITIEKYLLIRA